MGIYANLIEIAKANYEFGTSVFFRKKKLRATYEQTVVRAIYTYQFIKRNLMIRSYKHVSYCFETKSVNA